MKYLIKKDIIDTYQFILKKSIIYNIIMPKQVYFILQTTKNYNFINVKIKISCLFGC